MGDTGVVFTQGMKVEQNPSYYSWEVLVSDGDVEKIKLSLADQFLDFTKDREDPILIQWVERLQRIQKPYVLAEGKLTEEWLGKEKRKIERNYRDALQNNKKTPKRRFELPVFTVYGLFSKSA